MSLTPTEINAIFDLDPLEHTNEHIDALIAKYRTARTQFKVNDVREKKEKKPKIALDLSTLGELDLSELK